MTALLKRMSLGSRFDFLPFVSPHRDSVSSAVHEPMHVFWEMMEYFANTMVFVYTGVKVALEIYEQNNSRIQGSDWALAILLYVVLNVSEFCSTQLCNISSCHEIT